MEFDVMNYFEHVIGFPYNAGVKCNTFGVINNFLNDVQVEKPRDLYMY